MTHSWTDIARSKWPTRYTRPRRRQGRWAGSPIAALRDVEIGYGQVVPDLDTPTVTYCSHCQESFDLPWPIQRHIYRQRCPTCGRDDDWCLRLPRWEFYNLYVRGNYFISELP